MTQFFKTKFLKWNPARIESRGGGLQEIKQPPEKEPYADVEELRNLFRDQLNGKKFMLDCCHRVTFGFYLGNDITIRNGKIMKIICSECGC